MGISIIEGFGETVEPTVNPVVEVNGAFNFGEPKEVETEEEAPKRADNADIPQVPKAKASKDSDGARDSARNSKRGSAAYKARQAEYQTRIAMAKEVSPFVDIALSKYLDTRGVSFDLSLPQFHVTYWIVDTNKGEAPVKGPIPEAMAFHGLAGVGGLNIRLVEWIENHPGIFGVFFIGAMMLYLEFIIQGAIAQQARAEAANVAVPEP